MWLAWRTPSQQILSLPWLNRRRPYSRRPDPGRASIQSALSWVLTVIQQTSFDVVEVDTRHTLADGAEVTVRQVFVGEIGAHGLLVRLQCYAPYPPPA
jgi:hypothetical protein